MATAETGSSLEVQYAAAPTAQSAWTVDWLTVLPAN